jgi:uncharacterized protein DUF87
MEGFLSGAGLQDHPIRVVVDFLENEDRLDKAGKYDEMKFIGYVLEIGYETATIITSDPFKLAVGGLPRNSYLIMVPYNMGGIQPHFTLMRVIETAPTPLSNETQQTFFELHKKSMPELDVFTQSELQWGALKCSVLGMYYPNPQTADLLEFSGDVNNIVSPHKYKIYSPDEELLKLIINSLIPEENNFVIGNYRPTECRLSSIGVMPPVVEARASLEDFIGARTAMFGKTRLGKSNIVKIIASEIIESTNNGNQIGQLIFDVNGEYANDNPQDNNKSIKSAYAAQCEVYAITPKANTPSSPLKLNFYEQPDSSLPVLSSMLSADGRESIYIQAFTSVELPSLNTISTLQNPGDRTRASRKIQIYWAILHAAGYAANEQSLSASLRGGGGCQARGFDPGFAKPLRELAYGGTPPAKPNSLATLQTEMEKVGVIVREDPSNHALRSTSSNTPLFEADDKNLFKFLSPSAGSSGPSMISKYRQYHDKDAGDFVDEITNHLEQSKTVILDLGNASEEVVNYFSELLSRSIFNSQQNKFSNNNLGDHYIQIYFEEAHNLFPTKADPKSIYSRFAKEGAKYHIGIVYSTQSPSTIYGELLAQTENFFVGHLSSEGEAKAIGKLHHGYSGLEGDLMQAKQPGYVRMLTKSHRYVVPVQARLFEI